MFMRLITRFLEKTTKFMVERFVTGRAKRNSISTYRDARQLFFRLSIWVGGD